MVYSSLAPSSTAVVADGGTVPFVITLDCTRQISNVQPSGPMHLPISVRLVRLQLIRSCYLTKNNEVVKGGEVVLSDQVANVLQQRIALLLCYLIRDWKMIFGRLRRSLSHENK